MWPLDAYHLTIARPKPAETPVIATTSCLFDAISDRAGYCRMKPYYNQTKLSVPFKITQRIVHLNIEVARRFKNAIMN